MDDDDGKILATIDGFCKWQLDIPHTASRDIKQFKNDKNHMVFALPL